MVERIMRIGVLPHLWGAATIVGIGAGVLLFLARLAVGEPAAVPRAAASPFDRSTRVHAPMTRGPASGTGGAFAFVSTFEDIAFDGWTSISGATPTITTHTTYFTEPSLRSAANQGPQIDVANQGFVPGQSLGSSQVAMNAARGAGYVAFADASHAPLAVVGVSGGTVWAGADMTHLASVGTVPQDTAFP